MRLRSLCLVTSVVLGIAASTSIWAAEVDNFTKRHELSDATSRVNDLMNSYLQQAVEEAQQDNLGCSALEFSRLLVGIAGGSNWSTIENDIWDDETIPQKRVRRRHSVYRQLSAWEAPALRVVSLAPLIEVSGYPVGTDKLGHFIQNGFEYYAIALEEGLEAAISYGERTERRQYGILTTGIYSYADLAANLDGYHFYRDLLHPSRGYVSCENSQWQVTRYFDWSEWVLDSWDEAANCNCYWSQRMVEKVSQQIGELGESCPGRVNSGDLITARQRYAGFMQRTWPEVGNLSRVCR